MKRWLSLFVLVAVAVGVGCSWDRAVGKTESSSPVPPERMIEERLAGITKGLVFAGDRLMVDSESVCQAQGEAVARTLVEEGWAAVRHGQRLAALETFTAAVCAAPWLADPYSGLGRALTSVGRYHDAVAARLTALDIEPQRIDLHLAAATALQQVGRLDEAMDQWLQVTSRDPDNREAHARLTVAYYLRGDISQARDELAGARNNGGEVPSFIVELLTTGALRRAEIREGASAASSGMAPQVAIGPAVRIDVSSGTADASETTIAAADPHPDVLVAGWNDLQDGEVRVGVAMSHDGGETWTDFLLRPPPANQSYLEGDPATAYDHRTGNLWAGGVSYEVEQGGVFVARKQPGLAAFDTAVMVNPTSEFVDKPWLGTGPIPGQPESTRLFVAYHMFLQYSDDFGTSWSTPVGVEYGYGHLPRVASTGEVYVAYWDCDTGIKLQRSLDGGDTLSPAILIDSRVDIDVQGVSYPGYFRVWPFTYIAVDRNNGTLYAVWHDVTGTIAGNANVDLLFSRSTDQGVSWSPAAVVNGDASPPGDQFFPWLETDADGRLHMLFLDTRNTIQNDMDAHGWIDAYYSTSDDGGATWTEYRLTEAPFDSSLAALDFIGDYCGLTVAGDRVYPVYPSSASGDMNVYVHAIVVSPQLPFIDGFELGNTSRWTQAVDGVVR